MKMSRRIEACFEVAKIISWQRDMVHRHGAVLLRGGAVVNTSCNKSSHCTFALRFTEKPARATRHAEVGGILGLGREITNGASVFVTRTSKLGETRMSRPCPMCAAMLRFVGVKRIYYTLDEPGEYDILKL